MYQCKMIKLFLGIFRRDKRIFRNMFKYFYPVFSDPVCSWQARSVDRNGRPNQGPVDRRAQHVHVWQTLGWPTDRATGPESFALCIWAVDRISPTVIFLTVGGRPARSTASLSGCQISLTVSFVGPEAFHSSFDDDLTYVVMFTNNLVILVTDH